MRTSKRQQFIKDLVDEEYGPELTVDEIYNSIDFSRREGYTEFKRRRNLIRIANVFILLICMAITCVVTFKVSDGYSTIGFETESILDNEEIEYLNVNGYKYHEFISNIIIYGETNIYVIIAEKGDSINAFLKVETSKYYNGEIIIKDNNSNIKNELNEDFYYLSEQQKNQKKFTFTITYNGITNEYSFENN